MGIDVKERNGARKREIDRENARKELMTSPTTINYTHKSRKKRGRVGEKRKKEKERESGREEKEREREGEWERRERKRKTKLRSINQLSDTK